MGITGLIPFLEKASNKINLKDIKGCAVAVDTYCWLHKGAIACADKLIRGESTDVHVKFCLKLVNLLLHYNIKPILVFDGQHLPAKAQTENRRREIRKNSKKRAAELLRMGNVEEARSHMRRCIDITHEMALQLIMECRKINVDCIVAPYEADAQIAYLNKSNLVEYVITEDSDLTLFGCKKIIFKLDLAGNGLLVDSEKYHLAMGCRLEKYTFDKFRYMCILSGCDYLDSLPGIGLAKACKFILLTEETDMRRALTKIPAYLNMRNLTVTEEYIDGFFKADATFKHMFVYDPLKREMVRLNELSEFGTDIEYCSNAGQELNNEISFQLALGNLNPFTLKMLDNWNPDVYYAELKNQGKQLKSIWNKNSDISRSKRKIYDIRCALEYKKINLKPALQFNDTEEKSLENDVMSLYTSPPNEMSRKRFRNKSDSEDSNSSVENIPKNRLLSPPIRTPTTKNTHNPFAKSNSDTPSSSQRNGNNLSFLKNISPAKIYTAPNYENSNTKVVKVKQIVKSRLFSSNRLLLKTNDNANTKNDDDEPDEVDVQEAIIKEIGELHEQQKITSSVYISSPESTKKQVDVNRQKEDDNKINCDNEISQNILSENEVIDVDNWKQPSPKINLNNKKSRINLSKSNRTKMKYKLDDKSQSRLSMFGFKRKSSLTHT